MSYRASEHRAPMPCLACLHYPGPTAQGTVVRPSARALVLPSPSRKTLDIRVSQGTRNKTPSTKRTAFCMGAICKSVPPSAASALGPPPASPAHQRTGAPAHQHGQHNTATLQTAVVLGAQHVRHDDIVASWCVRNPGRPNIPRTCVIDATRLRACTSARQSFDMCRAACSQSVRSTPAAS